ncbi:MAG: hypothetical protein UX91_C0012G0009 [Candidatus Amesbacteria bacterium GW2011_GWB1_47_19]|nr:MAG: hypothetical protein UW51_C0011G0009 [Candidatus Amesbacteria bacterium GW2011_GWA1_44_24]KKU66498.1 MAG: hypothetical protein UX91_C0012G0009 [Candidatus Amesbacteria bacterium GW2011_GWB1_47_19]HBC73241.1 hypothetical protein [Candidatus Amesbacteria bacterium]
MGDIKSKSPAGEIAAIALVIGIGLWSVWPAVVRPGGVADYGKDGVLLIWIMNQTINRLPSGVISGGGKGLFDGNIFYPYKHVLAYSELQMVSALWAWLPVKLTGNPAVAAGTVMVLGQVLTMAVVYGWWRKMTGNRWAAAAGAVALGMSQVRWHYQVHLQMWSMQYWLAGVWLVSSWTADKKTWKLYTGVTLLGVQAWESILPVYFALVVLSAQYSVLKIRLPINKILTGGLLFGMVAFSPLRAYWAVSREMGFVRTIRDAAHGGMSVNELGERFASPGLYVLLAVSLLIIFNQIQRSKYKKDSLWLGIVLIISLVMAMGPVLKWQDKTVKIGGRYPVPLPYAAAYYLVPGIQAFRVPSRWLWVSAWAASGLIALSLKSFQSNPNLKIRKIIGMFGVMAVAVTGGTRLTNYRNLLKPAEYPAVYRWLGKQPGKVIVELPAGDENIEPDRMLYSLKHGKYLLNGYSGFVPPEREKLLEKLNQEWPSPETDALLRNIGVDYVIVNKLMTNFKFSIFNQIPNLNNVIILYDDENNRVYKL